MHLHKTDSSMSRTRFKTPEQLLGFLQKADDGRLTFRAYPISGDAETFRCQGGGIVVRKPDGKSFHSLDDFVCYAFQCDREGYAGTEHVDVEELN